MMPLIDQEMIGLFMLECLCTSISIHHHPNVFILGVMFLLPDRFQKSIGNISARDGFLYFYLVLTSANR